MAERKIFGRRVEDLRISRLSRGAKTESRGRSVDVDETQERKDCAYKYNVVVRLS